MGSSLMGWGMGMLFSLPLSSVNIFVSFLLKQASGSVCNGFIIEMGPFSFSTAFNVEMMDFQPKYKCDGCCRV
jgi:hypothetical protein